MRRLEVWNGRRHVTYNITVIGGLGGKKGRGGGSLRSWLAGSRMTEPSFAERSCIEPRETHRPDQREKSYMEHTSPFGMGGAHPKGPERIREPVSIF